MTQIVKGTVPKVTHNFNFNDSRANLFVIKMAVGKISTTEYTMNQTSF